MGQYFFFFFSFASGVIGSIVSAHKKKKEKNPGIKARKKILINAIFESSLVESYVTSDK